MALRLSAELADITTLDVDAIVNAANSSLSPGGGVCGAIHRAAGPQLARACAKLAPCPTGDARITPGFDLPARFVIHALADFEREAAAGRATDADLERQVEQLVALADGMLSAP